MNRRSFIRKLFGAAGAIVAGPAVLELAAKSAPKAIVGINPAWQSAEFEAAFIIPQEMIDEWMAKTVWYWNDLALKNLVEGAKKTFP